MSYQNEVYFSTVCLEPNRWNGNPPAVRVSQWLEPIGKAGFDGIELWDRHALLCDNEEREKLINSPVPIRILGTQVSGDRREESARQRVKDLVLALGAKGILFNFTGNPDNIMGDVSLIDHWLGSFTGEFRRICELDRGASLSVDDFFAARTILEGMNSPVEGICHAFERESTDFIYKYFHFLGNRLTHIHAQRIRERGVNGELVVKILKDCGFTGSYGIEFTTGVDEPHENINHIFDNAKRDHEILRRWIAN